MLHAPRVLTIFDGVKKVSGGINSKFAVTFFEEFCTTVHEILDPVQAPLQLINLDVGLFLAFIVMLELNGSVLLHDDGPVQSEVYVLGRFLAVIV